MAEKKNKNNTSKLVSKPTTAPKLTKTLQDRLKAARKTGQSALVKTRQKAARTGEKFRADTGPVLKKTAAGLGRQSQRSGKALGSIYANKLLPKLVLLRGWIAKRMHPGSLVRDYHRLVLLIHKLGPDRAIENLCFISTSKRTPLSIVRVPHQLRQSGHDYRPTPRLVFKWAMEALPESIERYEFVDYGAGRGRVLLMASQHPFEKITGAEIAEEFHDECILNIAQFPRSLMKCRDVSCEHLNALRLNVPEQETVFFLNNPFNRDMLERVISQIARSYRQDTRRFYLICVDISDQEIVMDTGIFEEVKIPWQQKLKISAFSPYSINLYRTVI